MDNRSVIEIWENIKGYEGLYQVSNYGRVKRFNKTKRSKPFKILKPGRNIRNGCLYVVLCRKGKTQSFKIHRLVLETFVGPCPPGMEGCHNNGNPSDNFVDNLRWDTHINNENDKIKHDTLLSGSRHYLSKFNNNQIVEIRELAGKEGMSQRKIAKIYGVSPTTIYKIIKNISYKIKENSYV